MRDIINKLKQLEESQTEPSGPQVGDEFGISFSEDLEISTTITDVLEDGIVVEMDDDAITHMTENGVHLYDGEIVESDELDETEAQKGLDGKRCWKGYRRQGTKMKGGKRVDNCVKVGEGIEEAGFAGDPQNRDGLKPWLRLSQLMDQEITKISLKSDEGIELSTSLEAVTNMIQSNDNLLNALSKTGEPKAGSKVVRQLVDLVKGQLNKGESIPVKADSEDMIKFINATIDKFNAGAEFDRTKIKDPNPEPEMEKEDSELDRIKSLSGVQTEGHGPEVDSFLEKVAAMPASQEKMDMAEKAYRGEFGPDIQKAIEDMYNEAKKSVGDMDDVMDDVLDMIEKDYGPKEDIGVDEAEYQGRKVSLGKPTRGDVKKFKVYVKNPKGNVVKVNFGDPNMKIKKSNPARRKSFRARHNCANPGPRHKARYWSCRKW